MKGHRWVISGLLLAAMSASVRALGGTDPQTARWHEDAEALSTEQPQEKPIATQQPVAGAVAPAKGELIQGTTLPVARFVPGYFEPSDVVTSFALKRAFAKATDLPPEYAVRPTFQRLADGKHRARIEIPAGTSLYGTGEASGPLLRNGRTVTLWNTDAYAYDIESPSLYQSHAWVLAVRPDGSAFGVFADTTYRTTIDLDAGITITAEGTPFPLYIIDRATPQEVCTALMELTGAMPLPPKWAIGYQQCRYSYYPDTRVMEIASEFRKRRMPCDGIWLDIDHMDAAKVFTFDTARFPNPSKMVRDLKSLGYATVWILDPGIKVEKGYDVYDELTTAGGEVRIGAKNEPYQGAVWPGLCVFPDFTSDKARAWWSLRCEKFVGLGIDGLWNDMNEPAIFGNESKTMPIDALHAGGSYSSGPGVDPAAVAPGTHARFHNVYGLLMSQATSEGLAKARPEKRPFVLTRAGFMGSQRYAATWTGDNTASWFDLEHSISMTLNLGLSGQPFSGADIGGFHSNGPVDELERGRQFARWFGVGTLMPFARGHTGKGNINKEPWAFGAAVEATCRRALERRYRLMPYLYTLFREASVTGLPVVRPAFFADPKDPALRSEDDCFLLGGDVLVVPQLMPDGSRVSIRPRGIWRRLELESTLNTPSAPAASSSPNAVGAASAGPGTPGAVVSGGDSIDPDLPRLRVREGAIVPLGPVMQRVDEATLDPLTLVVSLDTRGQAIGTLYEDAGEGFAYQRGEFLLTTYAAKLADEQVTVSVSKAEGKMPRPTRRVIVQVLRDDGRVATAEGVDGQPIVVPMK